MAGRRRSAGGDAGRRHGAGVARPPAAVRDPARDPRRERGTRHLPRQQARQPRPRHHVHPGRSRTGSRRCSSATSRWSSTRSACSSSSAAASAASICRPRARRCATWSAASSTACSRASPAPRSSPRRPCAGASATPCASSRATRRSRPATCTTRTASTRTSSAACSTQLADQADVALDNLRLLHERREHETHDPLTGLLNFRQLRERAAFELARAERHGRKVAFVMLDLDDFRTVNETAGREAGDEVLRALGGGAHGAAAQLRPGLPLRRRRVPAGAAGDRRPAGRRRCSPACSGRCSSWPCEIGRPGASPSRPRPASRASRTTAATRRGARRQGGDDDVHGQDLRAAAASPSTPARRAPDAGVAARVELLVVGSLHRDFAPAARALPRPPAAAT